MNDELKVEFGRFLVGAEGKRKSSLVNYLAKISSVEKKIDKSCECWSTEDLMRYFERGQAVNMINTLRNEMAAIKRFWAWYAKEYNKVDITKDIKGIKEEKTFPHVISKQDFIKMIYQCDLTHPNAEQRFCEMRNAAMLFMFADSGLRISELLGLKMRDIVYQDELKRMEINVVHTKSYRNRRVPFAEMKSGSLTEIFLIYWAHIQYNLGWQPDHYVFTGQRDKSKPLTVNRVEVIVSKIAEKAGISGNITPHSLRHFYATYLYQAKGDLILVQQRLGHALISTTEKYVHISDLVNRDALKYNPLKGIEVDNKELSGWVRLMVSSRK